MFASLFVFQCGPCPGCTLQLQKIEGWMEFPFSFYSSPTDISPHCYQDSSRWVERPKNDEIRRDHSPSSFKKCFHRKASGNVGRAWLCRLYTGSVVAPREHWVNARVLRSCHGLLERAGGLSKSLNPGESFKSSRQQPPPPHRGRGVGVESFKLFPPLLVSDSLNISLSHGMHIIM